MSEVEPSILLFAGRFSVRGSCAYTLRLAEQLPQRGLRVAIACPDARMVGRERRRELHIREFPHLQWPIWGVFVREMMLRKLQADPPDLIHVQSRHALSHAAPLARRLQRPFVLTIHDHLAPHERLNLDRAWCRRIIAVSESVKGNLIGRTDLPEGLITVIHSGVDAVPATERNEVFQTGRTPVVGTAGPLEEVKGFPFFLNAAARVLARGREVEFIVAGAGPEESNLRRLARELGINDHVTFVPNLPDFDNALAAMDIFVLPSLQQGIGTIMLDAMALGRPVIATKVGGVHGVVRDNETGLLVPPSNSETLAERMVELLDNPARARNLGHAARETVERDFNAKQMVEQTANLYRQVLRPQERVN